MKAMNEERRGEGFKKEKRARIGSGSGYGETPNNLKMHNCHLQWQSPSQMTRKSSSTSSTESGENKASKPTSSATRNDNKSSPATTAMHNLCTTCTQKIEGGDRQKRRSEPPRIKRRQRNCGDE
ncbi:hypothetical protein QVD17_39336 [Tagetes erecta]|uniref:Uncharacterized protein n=1 Tax=Tagetes erecta TaxID=13708 RepID=A0AAD8JS33_TARER|nr:hypothetical protein QVD17_39336 [Tagetes erecta]